MVAVNLPAAPLTLDLTPLRERRIVTAVHAPPRAPEWAQRLEEIGFMPGEQVELLARGALGGDPLVVRVGLSTFALRRAEAACILVEPAA
ncbi:MAG: ferrous iron transport protein A [Burkholderiaceae bacterium]|nr:ferrous iron transport protein A [Burkholderiaceae bacterium]